MTPTLPLAFGFGNLAMLGWLGAAAAPILIHLWMRHTHRDTPWAAMEFLRKAIERNSRRLKLQQWLLLAVRTLMLVLLALAAAKPYLSGWTLLTGGPQVHRVLVIDRTMSMQYAASEQSSFQKAKRLATELLDDARPGDLFSLCFLSNDAEQLVVGPTSDARRVAAQVAMLEPSFAEGHPGDVLATVTEILDNAEANHRGLSGHEVLLLTDAARSSWQSVTTGEADEAQLAKLADRAQVTLVDVGPTSSANISVGNLRISSGLPTTAEPIRLQADVTNHSKNPVTDLTVQLVVDGTSVDEQVVTLPARTTLPMEFDARFTEAGWRKISVRTAGDALAADDQAWLALEVRPSIRVLAVEGSPRAARYLRHALDPSGDGDSPITVQVAPEGALIDLPLTEFDVVFLCNVARFTSAERTLLDRYVRQGGNLVVMLGDRVLPESYNAPLAQLGTVDELIPGTLLAASAYLPITRMLLQVDAGVPDSKEKSAPSWLPARIGRLKTSEEPGIDPLDYRHPIAGAFRDHERAGLLSTPVTKYFELTPNESAEVALALPGGDALLVTRRYGRGMVALLATPATLDTVDSATNQPWTLLPAWPSFLPIVRELIAFGLQANRSEDRATVNDTLFDSLPSSFSKPTVPLSRPDQRTDSVPVEREGDSVTWQYDSTNLPGIYSAGEPTLSELAINVPTSESDLTRIDLSTLPSEVQVQSSPPDAEQAAASLAASNSLHRTLLYIVLALLLIEPVLAWWFAGRAI